ncbi:uncharacterized protein LOC119682928 [Teleopsis dalmanni]|uniref:uncharacterized protein LOC119682928 n=1 Tax=Teleopsis dalmanni TaxID=139649 RepID=UPI0018CE0288|nr:uncharacterized protein LOC119682928 [Teleopsis dalmanni]
MVSSMDNKLCGYLLPMLAAIIFITKAAVKAEGQVSVDDDFHRILGKCKSDSDGFDDCMRDAFNDLRAYFPTGVPEYSISPFDPHYASFIELRRGDQKGLGGFKLILRNVSEYGWTKSEVTKYHSDKENQQIIYTQYFPEKSLEGLYEFSSKMLGTPLKRKGYWNMTLYDYSQTTSIRRIAGPGSLLKVHVEIEHIGGLKMHITNFIVQGRDNLNNFADGIINSMWPIGFPFIKPFINELVSTAFTDIFNESFRHFPIEKFLSS